MEINPIKDDHHEKSFSIGNEQRPQNASELDSTSEINQFKITEDLGKKTQKAKRSSYHVRMGEKLSCSLCDKQFHSVKAVYGHFRCHKESKKAVTLRERLNIIPKKKRSLRSTHFNNNPTPMPICKKKRSSRKRRICFTSSNYNNPSLVFDAKSSSSSSVKDDVDEEMLEGAETLILFSSKVVVFDSHNHVSDDNEERESYSDPGRKRKIEEEEEDDDEGRLIKTFKKRRLNQTDEKRFYGLHYVRRNK